MCTSHAITIYDIIDFIVSMGVYGWLVVICLVAFFYWVVKTA